MFASAATTRPPEADQFAGVTVHHAEPTGEVAGSAICRATCARSLRQLLALACNPAMPTDPRFRDISALPRIVAEQEARSGPCPIDHAAVDALADFLSEAATNYIRMDADIDATIAVSKFLWADIPDGDGNVVFRVAGFVDRLIERPGDSRVLVVRQYALCPERYPDPAAASILAAAAISHYPCHRDVVVEFDEIDNLGLANRTTFTVEDLKRGWSAAHDTGLGLAGRRSQAGACLGGTPILLAWAA